MSDPSELPAIVEPPEGMAPPIPFHEFGDFIELWSGTATLTNGDKSTVGSAKLVLELTPRPAFTFELTRDGGHPSLSELFKSLIGSGDSLGKGHLTVGDPFRVLTVSANSIKANRIIGRVEWNASDESAITSARYMVINGAQIHDQPLKRGNSCFGGRSKAEIDDVTITVDQLQYGRESRHSSFEFTHVAEIRFKDPRPASSLRTFEATLFRTLSLIKNRWVGLLGPWLYNDSQLIRILPNVSKTSRYGHSYSWYPDTVRNVFHDLLGCQHNAYSNLQRAESIQTGFHWLIESSLCAGGVEGAIILQQAALESLAWGEIVQNRKLCSISGFEKLPASDRIRWMLSLYSISANIPDHCNDLLAYAKEYGFQDLVEILADVRNALVHGIPKKVERILRRSRGEDERTELWVQVGGLLEQSVLAAIGYNGDLVRRDLNVALTIQAIKPAPWAKKNIVQ